jgi:NAD(P)-dependent dehydrogenase (short-subunit alcohol dehydrogenase family)
MPDSARLLAGKVVLVTGASRGIGAAACHLFAQEGATVVASARSESDLKAVAWRIEDAGGTSATLPRRGPPSGL